MRNPEGDILSPRLSSDQNSEMVGTGELICRVSSVEGFADELDDPNLSVEQELGKTLRPGLPPAAPVSKKKPATSALGRALRRAQQCSN